MVFVGGGGRAHNNNDGPGAFFPHNSNGRAPHNMEDLITYGDHGPDPYGSLAHQAPTIGAARDHDRDHRKVTILSPRTALDKDHDPHSHHSPRPDDADSRVSTVWRAGCDAWLALLILLIVCICVAPRWKPIPEDEGVQDLFREVLSLREDPNTIEPILPAQENEDVRGVGGGGAAGFGAAALPPGTAEVSSSDQHRSSRAFFPADTAYQTRVRDAISHSFNGYALKSFGKDSPNPLNGVGSNWIGLGVAILDVLDTLWYADLMSEFSRCVEFVTNLEPGTNMRGSFFETSIRALGGLMGGYTLSKEKVLLDKAEALGVVLLQNAFGGGLGLLPSFSPTLTPTTWEKLQDSSNGRYSTRTSLADAGSEQLEFRSLARHTQKPFLQKFPVRAFDAIVASPGAKDGLVPSCVGATGGPNWKVGFCRADVTLSGPGDSFYEYLLKQWILLTKAGKRRQNSKGEIPLGKYWGASGASSSSSFEQLYPQIRKNDVGNSKPSDADLEAAESYRLMWLKAMKQMWYRLVSRTDVGTVYIGVLRASGSWEPVMEHLACFVPGMLMLGVESGAVDTDDWDFVPAVGEAGWGSGGADGDAGSGNAASAQEGVRWTDRFRQLAQDLTETCVRMHTHTASGLAPEAMRFRDAAAPVSEKVGIKLPGMLGAGGKHPDMEFMSVGL